MPNETPRASIRNIAEVPWKEFPDHFGGALSKPLVNPENVGARHLDYRISMYQPMAYVKLHKHKVQEQIYHVLDGEGLMDIAGERRVVRKHDVIYLPARRRARDPELGAGRPGIPGRHVAAERRLTPSHSAGRASRGGPATTPGVRLRVAAWRAGLPRCRQSCRTPNRPSVLFRRDS